MRFFLFLFWRKNVYVLLSHREWILTKWILKQLIAYWSCVDLEVKTQALIPTLLHTPLGCLQSYFLLHNLFLPLYTFLDYPDPPPPEWRWWGQTLQILWPTMRSESLTGYSMSLCKKKNEANAGCICLFYILTVARGHPNTFVQNWEIRLVCSSYRVHPVSFKEIFPSLHIPWLERVKLLGEGNIVQTCRKTMLV